MGSVFHPEEIFNHDVLRQHTVNLENQVLVQLSFQIQLHKLLNRMNSCIGAPACEGLYFFLKQSVQTGVKLFLDRMCIFLHLPSMITSTFISYFKEVPQGIGIFFTFVSAI